MKKTNREIVSLVKVKDAEGENFCTSRGDGAYSNYYITRRIYEL